MMRKFSLMAIATLLFSCDDKPKSDDADGYSGATTSWTVQYKEEVHFDTAIQLTNGGDNAEAYWSFDDSKIVFQATNAAWGDSCD